MIAMLWIKAVVHMAMKTSSAVEPRTGTDKDAAIEPLGTVVAIRSAVVGSVIVIAVRASGLRTNVDAYGDLSARDRGDAEKGDSNGGRKNILQTTHKSPHWN